MKPRIVALLAIMLLVSGCTAMLMGGGGRYEPPSDECSEEDRREGRCG